MKQITYIPRNELIFAVIHNPFETANNHALRVEKLANDVMNTVSVPCKWRLNVSMIGPTFNMTTNSFVTLCPHILRKLERLARRQPHKPCKREHDAAKNIFQCDS